MDKAPKKQARKPRSYASLKLQLTDSLTYLLTRVKCRATSVAKNYVKKGVLSDTGLLPGIAGPGSSKLLRLLNSMQ